jgi:hypothetical protein
MIRIPFTLVTVFLLTLHPTFLDSSVQTESPDRTDPEFFPYKNLLPNHEMESDEDLNNVPDGWNLYPWLPEDSEFLKEAVMRYLDLEVPEIGVSMEGRRAFLGERSVRFFTPSGNIGPGIWTTVALSPGLYTLNLVARSVRDHNRVVATFLAQDGKLTQVDRKWRWIHHSEHIPFSTPESVISINDWTFEEGGIFVDHVSLIKVPFEIIYDKRVQLMSGENQYVIEIRNIHCDVLPIGANLELYEPSGNIIRKNMELDVTEENYEFKFTVSAEKEGEYSASIELYNPRTTEVLFSDERIKAYLEAGPEELSDSLAIEEAEDDFFPIGMSIRGYEIDALEDKGMNTVLLKDPALVDIEEVISKADEIGLGVIMELDATDSSHLSEVEKSLIQAAGSSSSLIGYSLLSGWGGGRDKFQSLRSVSNELRALDPDRMIILRNYLPGPLDGELLRSVDALFVDPFPITIPSKPIYTISQWFDRAKQAAGSEMKYVAMIQAFAGWPYAKRAPTLAEMRALSSLALNRGADGIFLHTFSDDFPYFDDPASSNWDIRRIKELWDGIEVLVKEIKDFHKRFGKPQQSDFEIRFIPDSVVDIAYFKSEDSLFVQIVNVTPADVGIRSISPLYRSGDAAGIIPGYREIDCGDGFFEDKLPPFGVRIYHLPVDLDEASAALR